MRKDWPVRLHKATELPKEEFKREVEKHLTGGKEVAVLTFSILPVG